LTITWIKSFQLDILFVISEIPKFWVLALNKFIIIIMTKYPRKTAK